MEWLGVGGNCEALTNERNIFLELLIPEDVAETFPAKLNSPLFTASKDNLAAPNVVVPKDIHCSLFWMRFGAGLPRRTLALKFECILCGEA